MTNKIVAMIPARGGSKGLPGKNMRTLDGKPLIYHSIKPALDCGAVGDVYFNSDDPSYLEVAEEYGAIPFRRRPELGADNTSMKEVLVDFVTHLQAQEVDFDGVLVLYPTYPFRTPEQLEDIVTVFTEEQPLRPMLGFKEPSTHPYRCFGLASDGIEGPVIPHDPHVFYRRQDYPDCYEMCAWAACVPVHRIKDINNQLLVPDSKPYRIPSDAVTIDVDSADDFLLAEFLVERYRNK